MDATNYGIIPECAPWKMIYTLILQLTLLFSTEQLAENF